MPYRFSSACLSLCELRALCVENQRISYHDVILSATNNVGYLSEYPTKEIYNPVTSHWPHHMIGKVSYGALIHATFTCTLSLISPHRHHHLARRMPLSVIPKRPGRVVKRIGPVDYRPYTPVLDQFFYKK